MGFDALAAGYDNEFANRPAARWLRERVHERLGLHVKPGTRTLDLGCGTGIDSLWMAEHGAQVTALDASAAMLEITRKRLAGHPSAAVAPFDFNHLPAESYTGPFDLVLADFGALNLLEDWRPLAEWLIPRVSSGGVLCVAVMTRFCLWETAWNLLHFKPRRAARRWGGSSTFGDLTVTYPLIMHVVRAFLPEFRLTQKRGLGVFLPPSEMFGVIEKRPRLLKTLTRLDGWCWERGVGAGIADHTWIELTRR